jgi:hypothetical protein
MNMLRKILIINLLLALVWQPVALAFATTTMAAEVQGYEFSGNPMMALCEGMDMDNCVDRDNCSMNGHLNCDAKSPAVLTPYPNHFQSNQSYSILAAHRAYLSLQTNVPIRPPRHF